MFIEDDDMPIDAYHGPMKPSGARNQQEASKISNNKVDGLNKSNSKGMDVNISMADNVQFPDVLCTCYSYKCLGFTLYMYWSNEISKFVKPMASKVQQVGSLSLSYNGDIVFELPC